MSELYKVRILPYKRNSKSAKKLSQLTNWLRMKLRHTKCNPSTTFVVNWGNSRQLPRHQWPYVLNRCTGTASNKLESLHVLEFNNVSVPPFTDFQSEAKEWLKKGERVFARTVLNGHSGKGIVNMKELEDFVEAPLYTKYIPKKAEYRVHLTKHGIIQIQQKRQRIGGKVKDKYIRSWHNGYVFCVHKVDLVPGLEQLAIDALKALDLDFGAIDIIYGHDGKLYVLEVNTAPGLDNKTAELYAESLKDLLF